MTARQKILKLMSQRYRTHAGHCIEQLGLNPNTARGRLSELHTAGLIQLVCQGTPGVAGEYRAYTLTDRGRQAAFLRPDSTTTKKTLCFPGDPPLPMTP
jgi:predicted ArsR family transcriptional regulator